MKVRILSLDGGGVRGIIPAVILEHIEEQIIEITKNPDARISDYLDFCAGTSTGSIIAAMINVPLPNGRPAYKMSDIVNSYMTLTDKVFKKSLWQNIKTVWGLLHPKYTSKEINEELAIVLKDWTMDDMINPCAFQAYDIYKRRPNIYTSADLDMKYANYKVKHIVKGSTSIPAFFKPTFFKTNDDVDTLVDGGLFANNPSLVSYIEAGKTPSILANFKKVTPKNTLLLSFGTGQADLTHYSYKKTKRWGMVRWLIPILNIVLQGMSEVTTYETIKLFEASNAKKNYIRINPEIKLGKASGTDASKVNMENLMQDAKLYIDENLDLLENIAKDLIKQGK